MRDVKLQNQKEESPIITSAAIAVHPSQPSPSAGGRKGGVRGGLVRGEVDESR